MLPPPRRPFLASRARRRRGPGLATARRQWERRRRVSQERLLAFGLRWWQRYVTLAERSPVIAEGRYAGSATVRFS